MGDKYAKSDVSIYMKWLKQNHGITKVKGLNKKLRTALWVKFQQERSGFTHYYGDECDSLWAGPGHINILIALIRGDR